MPMLTLVHTRTLRASGYRSSHRTPARAPIFRARISLKRAHGDSSGRLYLEKFIPFRDSHNHNLLWLAANGVVGQGKNPGLPPQLVAVSRRRFFTATPRLPTNFSPRTRSWVRARGEKLFVISHFIQAGAVRVAPLHIVPIVPSPVEFKSVFELSARLRNDSVLGSVFATVRRHYEHRRGCRPRLERRPISKSWDKPDLTATRMLAAISKFDQPEGGEWNSPLPPVAARLIGKCAARIVFTVLVTPSAFVGRQPTFVVYVAIADLDGHSR
jgi:hypothetical protein